MRLLYKDIAPSGEINGNGSIKGGWIFEKMDYAALTIASEDFFWATDESIVAVTNSASIQYHNSVFPHEYVEIWGDYDDVSPAKLNTKLEFRQRKRHTNTWEVVATAVFSFSLINKETRKIVRIPKEVVNEIKG